MQTKILNDEYNKKFRTIKSLFLLVNGFFWGSLPGPFIAFIFPLIFIAILGWLIGYYAVLAGAISMAAMVIMLNSMPQAIFQFKNSCVLKRIGATPIKTSTFIIVVGVYYFIIMVLSLLWCLLWIVIIFAPYIVKGAEVPLIGETKTRVDSISQIFSFVDWGAFLYSWLLLVGIGTTFGMTMVSFAKTSLGLQTVGIFITIISMLLAAEVFPIFIIRSNDFLWYLGYVATPFKSVSTLMNESWNAGTSLQININNINNSNIFDVNNPFRVISTMNVMGASIGNKVDVCKIEEKIINLILPYVWIVAFSLIAAKNFKWSTR